MASSGPDPSSFGAAGDRRDPPDPNEAFARLAGPVAAMLESYARMMTQLAGGPPQAATAKAATGGVDLPAALIEASAIASGSSMRYVQSLTDVVSRHQATLRDAAMAAYSDPPQSPARQRADAEQFRAFLRDVSETALLEARRLQHEFEVLGEAVAQNVGERAADGDGKRRRAVKP